jgi:hypothetical protein
MAQTFEEWAATEVHSPDDKISNFDKLTAPYLLNKYKTWGEVYKAAGIKPPKEKPKVKEADAVKDLDFKIKQAEIRIAKNEDELFRYEPGSTDYEETVAAVKRDKEELKKLQTRLDAVKKIETDKKEIQTFKKEMSSYEQDLADAKEAVQIAKDTNGDVAAAEAELKQVTASKPFAPSGGTAGQAPFGGQPTGYQNVGSQDRKSVV